MVDAAAGREGKPAQHGGDLRDADPGAGRPAAGCLHSGRRGGARTDGHIDVRAGALLPRTGPLWHRSARHQPQGGLLNRKRPEEFRKWLRHFIRMTEKNKQYGYGGIDKPPWAEWLGYTSGPSRSAECPGPAVKAYGNVD